MSVDSLVRKFRRQQIRDMMEAQEVLQKTAPAEAEGEFTLDDVMGSVDEGDLDSDDILDSMMGDYFGEDVPLEDIEERWLGDESINELRQPPASTSPKKRDPKKGGRKSWADQSPLVRYLLRKWKKGPGDAPPKWKKPRRRKDRPSADTHKDVGKKYATALDAAKALAAWIGQRKFKGKFAKAGSHEGPAPSMQEGGPYFGYKAWKHPTLKNWNKSDGKGGSGGSPKGKKKDDESDLPPWKRKSAKLRKKRKTDKRLVKKAKKATAKKAPKKATKKRALKAPAELKSKRAQGRGRKRKSLI